jgi:hypothetical protein
MNSTQTDLAQERAHLLNRLHVVLRDLIPASQVPTTCAGRAARTDSAQKLERLVRRQASMHTSGESSDGPDVAENFSGHDDHEAVDDGQRATGRGQGVSDLGLVVVEVFIKTAINRSPNADHFVSYTGTAPLDASSGEQTDTGSTPAATANSTRHCTPSRCAKLAIPVSDISSLLSTQARRKQDRK